jgi:hypothetical protein
LVVGDDGVSILIWGMGDQKLREEIELRSLSKVWGALYKYDCT